MRFLDLVKVQLRSGSGGGGAASFRREKFVEFGGPDGGDGGNGGSVYAEAVAELNTLIDYRYRHQIIAPNGQSGGGKQCHGAKGKSISIHVPIGTEILDESRSRILFDLTQEGQRELLVQGGKGGFGNRRFISSVNQAPRKANPGQPGTELTVWLRLKLFADIGLLGLPNAGKSTFLSTITRARPKIADYPFTTLHPVLGMLLVDNSEFVIADIPGLIKGAHTGRGIGDQFLGHIERCQVLIHLIDASSNNIVDDYKSIIEEITKYGNGLLEKLCLPYLSKVDAISEKKLRVNRKLLARHCGVQTGVLSAFSGVGINDCIQKATQLVNQARTLKKESKPWTP